MRRLLPIAFTAVVFLAVGYLWGKKSTPPPLDLSGEIEITHVAGGSAVNGRWQPYVTEVDGKSVRHHTIDDPNAEVCWFRLANHRAKIYSVRSWTPTP